MWTQILGSGEECKLFTDKLLWYAHYDKKENFDDWEANKFGGWQVPSLKQYTDNMRICDLLVDMSYYWNMKRIIYGGIYKIKFKKKTN